MNSWIHLPYEILLLIFSHVDCKTDLAQLQLTCSTWYKASQEQFYKAITIEGGKISTAEKLIKLFKKASYRGKLVKRINMETFFLMEFTHRQGTVYTFESLIKLCPNLEVLSAQHDSKFPFYQTIEKNRYYLKFLQEIPRPTNHQDMQYYIKTVLTLQKSIKRLYIGNIKANGDAIENNTLVNQLDSFSVLEDLEMLVLTHKNVFELENIINKCSPTVTHLTYTVYNNNFVERVVDNNNNNLAPVVILSRVKSFVGSNIIVTDASIQYLMHKFPNLNNLVVKLFNPIFIASRHQPEFELSTSVLIKFYKYISKMNNFDLFGKISREDDMFRYVKHFYQYGTTTTTTTNDSIFLKIEYSNDMTPIHYPYLHVLKNSVKYKKRYPAVVYYNTSIIEIGYLLNFNTTQLPHINIIRQFGSKINALQLSLRATQDYYIHQDINSQFHTCVLDRLDDILHYCSELKDLLLYDMYFSRNSTSDEKVIRTVNKSIERLYIEASAILYKTLYQLSMCMPSLKCVTFSSCDILETNIKKSPIIYINMPFTLFDCIIWKKRLPTLYQFKCYIIVSIENTDRYFKGDKVYLYNMTSQAFHKEVEEALNIDSHSIQRFKINCQRIQTLIVQLHNESTIKYDLNL